MLFRFCLSISAMPSGVSRSGPNTGRFSCPVQDRSVSRLVAVLAMSRVAIDASGRSPAQVR